MWRAMSQNVLSVYDEPLWIFENLGEWKLAIYEDYATFINFYEHVAEIMFKIGWG